MDTVPRLHWPSLRVVPFVLLGACGGSEGPTDPPPPANKNPVASVQVSPSEIPEGDEGQTVITLDGAGSTDPDGDALSFSWNAASATFVNGTSSASSVAMITLPGTATVTVNLTVSDGRGGSAQATAQIALGPPLNQAPTASISLSPTEIPQNDGNQTVVTLDGTGSSDPDGDALSYSWSVPGATFANGTDATSDVAQVTLPGTAAVTVTLTVGDGRGGTSEAQANIALAPPQNQAPVANIAPSATSVPRNDQSRTILTFDGRGSSDADGDALSYTWSAVGGAFESGTSATDAQISLSFPGAASVTVVLTVSDGNGGSGTAQQSISVGAIIERSDPSFSLDIQEIFGRRGCTGGGCHGSAQSAGLDLRSGSSHAALVGVTATSESVFRVVAGNANASYLVIKLEGRQNVGLRMPRGGAALNAVDLANIKNWINQGASNN